MYNEQYSPIFSSTSGNFGIEFESNNQVTTGKVYFIIKI